MSEGILLAVLGLFAASLSTLGVSLAVRQESMLGEGGSHALLLALVVGRLLDFRLISWQQILLSWGLFYLFQTLTHVMASRLNISRSHAGMACYPWFFASAMLLSALHLTHGHIDLSALFSGDIQGLLFEEPLVFGLGTLSLSILVLSGLQLSFCFANRHKLKKIGFEGGIADLSMGWQMSSMALRSSLILLGLEVFGMASTLALLGIPALLTLSRARHLGHWYWLAGFWTSGALLGAWPLAKTLDFPLSLGLGLILAVCFVGSFMKDVSLFFVEKKLVFWSRFPRSLL